jgi:hypothetical protein
MNQADVAAFISIPCIKCRHKDVCRYKAHMLYLAEDMANFINEDIVKTSLTFDILEVPINISCKEYLYESNPNIR